MPSKPGFYWIHTDDGMGRTVKQLTARSTWRTIGSSKESRDPGGQIGDFLGTEVASPASHPEPRRVILERSIPD